MIFSFFKADHIFQKVITTFISYVIDILSIIL